MYTLEKASLISAQLKKFTTAYTYIVVGQFANLDFWMGEVIGALQAIDGHRDRFGQLYHAQKTWTEEHGTVVHEYCHICRGRCEFSNGKPPLPQLQYKGEKIEARRELIDAAYYFLARCYRIGLLNQEELKQKCDTIGTSIDPNDLS